MQYIDAMLERRGRKYPENVAIVFEDAALACNDLSEAANRLAGGLKPAVSKRATGS